ncbi:TPA: hypothetical protein RGI49_001399 [Legionella pneumophila]|uniref:Uncharacterized protein n=1 Tax=Legionella pneumophila TaxID=446 RepID=A0AAP3HCW0_LEGPN|nr:hypothetical protein [Legionella pneumophila]HAT8880223.1 hypothetical protein [Legionella pneumophila subsp. pneumophila]MCW8403437.1 hypothetical protein [Legionella pneumophila]MCZ4691330.1 hypothetical protein [Legionella pneumophila]MCZ4698954.1 hypothetical protein [Legionella pneumophila]MCZ4709447.1 hypothetical protein [Legionella pneumophila]
MKSIFDNIIYIFEYVDKPVIFVSKTGNELFLISLYEDNIKLEKWLRAPLDEDEFYLLQNSLLDFYSIFNKHKDDLKLVAIDTNNNFIESVPDPTFIKSIEKYIPKQGVLAENLITIDNNYIYKELHR